jgi:DMSO/TMAO reductase YedYZ molybdopterin-dependent catalytic subunit
MTPEEVYDCERAERLARAAKRDGGVSRRDLLARAALGAAALGGLAGAARPQPARAATGPIVKPLPPEWFIPFASNAEMRWDALRDQGYLVPNERFFVRNHTATPLVDLATWRLELFGDGLRNGPVTLTYDDLLKLPPKHVTAFVECAGNGRSLFGSQQGTPTPGTQWKLGAIGVARWRGVALADVLERAGLRREAVDVMPEGLDAPVTGQGHVRRPLPVGKALDDVLVALEMNGETLPPDHGFPARLVVPGWIGISSIKWLGRIEVSRSPLQSPWNTTSYRMIGAAYPPDSPPLTTQPAKSAFELAWNAQVSAGEAQLLTGRAWSGTSPIRDVEVSTDGGTSWRRAHTRGPNVREAWVRWEVPWTPSEPGSTQLLARARARNRDGVAQPDAVPFNDLGYQFWAVARHPVTVV